MDMEYRRLGRSGLKVSAFSLGSWVTFGDQIDKDTAKACMVAAYEGGVNFFDNAEAYANGKSELVMGEIFDEVGWPRDSYVVSSKVFFGAERKGPNQRGLSRKHIFEACDAALKRLRVDYLDLYFCHRADPDTPIEETVEAMTDLVRLGKVLYWGTSEWNRDQIHFAHTHAASNGLVKPLMEQPQYNLFCRARVEREYDSLLRVGGMGTTIWSPLASGLLTGKYNKGIPPGSRMSMPSMSWMKDSFQGPEFEERVAKVRRLTALAEELDTTVTRLSLAWCLKNPFVSTVILGASKVEQVHDNLQALPTVERLTDEVMARIDEIVGVPNSPHQ